jgi:hypothetical protein
MTETSALCLPLSALDAAESAGAIVPEPPALRVAPRGPNGPTDRDASTARAVVLRNPDLVADLRRARAARFASRYEWLARRRRRAQIAARHALEG